MSEADKYRQYAKDCIRLASTMTGADRQTLLKIAEAWEGRACDAEGKRLGSGNDQKVIDGHNPRQERS
jgi:hypothetical protein